MLKKSIFDIEKYLTDNDWNIVHRLVIPEKIGKYYQYSDLNLTKNSKDYLSNFGSGIYLHQKIALQKISDGSNVCLATSTASGKSLVFFVSAIERISRNRDAKVLAVYPLKALATEQQQRWEKALKDSRLNAAVGRIDGGIPMDERNSIIRNSQVITMTPDIIHAWVLSNLDSKGVVNFLSKIELIIIDEAHIYTGVFGSNSAFLFRRLHHVIGKLGGNPKFISASATIKNPEIHLKNLVGVNFDIIEQTNDTSPKKSCNIVMVEPPGKSDILSAFSNLMYYAANNTDFQFISFVDSRKQTEYLVSITSRLTEKDELEDSKIDYDSLKKLNIFPYRSGYEEADRLLIQNRLINGELKGVVSTSALEIGIDIPYLTLGILFGIPNSATSFFQRIGRIGRHEEGTIIIINNGTVLSENIFRSPDEILNMPLSESTLYLENPRIQYIHALCLARQGGEDDFINNHLSKEEERFNTDIDFPDNFIALCNAERIGEISPEFQTMKTQAGEDPNHLFPLRDMDIQYKVELGSGLYRQRLGSLSFNQLLREAYPGAVYYYQAQSYRVCRINMFKKLVEVRSEKKYTTKPVFLPPMIFPNLSEGNIFNSIRFGDLIITESNLQIRESIIGFKERRGPNEIQIDYPLPQDKGIYFNSPRFTRNYFTTGVIINHPSLNGFNVKSSVLSEIIFEAFLITIPFERQDIGFGDDKHRTDREHFNKGDRFLSVFDQTYGSLRLTSRLIDAEIVRNVFEKALDIAVYDNKFSINEATLKALKDLKMSLSERFEQLTFGTLIEGPPENTEKIILPGSIGLNIKKENEEFYIDGVFYSRGNNCLMYRGKHLSQQTEKFTNGEITVPVSYIVEIPGESKIGFYDYESGRVLQDE